MKPIQCFCAAAIMFITATSAVSARPLDYVKASRNLHVVVYNDNKPFSWQDEVTGEPHGIEVDLARLIAKELGVNANILLRIAGESADDDVRSNVWQGPRTGGLKGDVMFHVPIDREFIGRNPLAAISNAYHYEEIVLAVRADAVTPDVEASDGLDLLKTKKVAVGFSTAGHYFLSFAKDASLRKNISPYRTWSDAVANFVEGSSDGLMGTKSSIDSALKDTGIELKEFRPEFPPTLIRAWNIGTAVQTDSRDVGYAVGKILQKMRTDGTLERVFAAHGVTYVPPPVRRKRRKAN